MQLSNHLKYKVYWYDLKKQNEEMEYKQKISRLNKSIKKIVGRKVSAQISD